MGGFGVRRDWLGSPMEREGPRLFGPLPPPLHPGRSALRAWRTSLSGGMGPFFGSVGSKRGQRLDAEACRADDAVKMQPGTSALDPPSSEVAASISRTKAAWQSGYRDGWRAKPITSEDHNYSLGYASGTRKRERAILSGAWYPGCGRPWEKKSAGSKQPRRR